MFNYVLRRLLLLPITLFFILLVNFVIVNMAPGDPTMISEVTSEGAKREDKSVNFSSEDRYLQFREFYGLTLPILFNDWPSITLEELKQAVWQLAYKKWKPDDKEEMPVKQYDELRILWGDRSKYIMPLIFTLLNDPNISDQELQVAIKLMVRGGIKQGYVGPDLSEEEKTFNRKVAIDNDLLMSLVVTKFDTKEEAAEKLKKLKEWYEANKGNYLEHPAFWQKTLIFFTETRFNKYMSRVLTLDFGTMRNDPNKTVLSEVTKRFKISLTLSLLPMLITFVFCQIFAFIMAIYQNRWPDLSLTLFFLVLYAIPIFVVAPFLIEKVALNNDFPFTDLPIPISGFTSPERIYSQETSLQRLGDILQHIALPIAAILYGSLASSTRLSRTAVLEVLRQDYVRTARAKGVPPFTIMWKHVGRNAAITIVTSIAGSLGVILGGSLIVETIFEIDGFGKFFYDAILNRDYNVIMFSALAGSFLSLLGYLVADLAYAWLDPRLTLD